MPDLRSDGTINWKFKRLASFVPDVDLIVHSISFSTLVYSSDLPHDFTSHTSFVPTGCCIDSCPLWYRSFYPELKAPAKRFTPLGSKRIQSSHVEVFAALPNEFHTSPLFYDCHRVFTDALSGSGCHCRDARRCSSSHLALGGSALSGETGNLR